MLKSNGFANRLPSLIAKLSREILTSSPSFTTPDSPNSAAKLSNSPQAESSNSTPDDDFSYYLETDDVLAPEIDVPDPTDQTAPQWPIHSVDPEMQIPPPEHAQDPDRDPLVVSSCIRDVNSSWTNLQHSDSNSIVETSRYRYEEMDPPQDYDDLQVILYKTTTPSLFPT